MSEKQISLEMSTFAFLIKAIRVCQIIIYFLGTFCNFRVYYINATTEFLLYEMPIGNSAYDPLIQMKSLIVEMLTRNNLYIHIHIYIQIYICMQTAENIMFRDGSELFHIKINS